MKRFFPFLRWLPYRGPVFKADLLAGLTVALVLIPQSMAYAQLAGLPAYFGLYAAFLPVAVAALWGSSNQLGSGPVAVVSLLTASTLAPLAQPGSDAYVTLAIGLALSVGLIQLTLGLLKLGVVVNFLSHPVIVGFSNAAALIIAMSQVGKLFGLTMPSSEFFMSDFFSLFGQLHNTHWPTLGLGLLALGLIVGLKRWRPKVPGVLVAVAVTTLLSWATGFERNVAGQVAQVKDLTLASLIDQIDHNGRQVKVLGQEQTRANEWVKTQQGLAKPDHVALIRAQGDLAVVQTQINAQVTQAAQLRQQLAQFRVTREVDAAGLTVGLYLEGRAPAGARLEDARYRVRGIADGSFRLQGGGEVVGTIPQGLPEFKLPQLTWSALVSLLSGAIVISLVGFMEAISIAKAIAAKTRQKLNPNQELIGQGLANLVGAFSQSYPVSGSFSRSAVNSNAGAQTGMSSVFTTLIVLVALLFLTPLLYHLPQAALGAIIITAVAGLINVAAVRHAWQASRDDGIAAVTTFVVTLLAAPHLDKGILTGAGLAVLLYLYRTMQPRVAQLGRHPDGTLRDIRVYPTLPTSSNVVALRFDASLYFANAHYFEEAVLDAVAGKPGLKTLLVVGSGINQIDASGEEVVRHLVQRLREGGITVVFAGLKKQVLDVMHRTGLYELIGAGHIFGTEDRALEAIYDWLGDEGKGELLAPRLRDLPA